jgi:hypothetical protein
MTASNYIAEFVADLWDVFVRLRWFLAVVFVVTGSVFIIGHVVNIAMEAIA